MMSLVLNTYKKWMNMKNLSVLKKKQEIGKSGLKILGLLNSLDLDLKDSYIISQIVIMRIMMKIKRIIN